MKKVKVIECIKNNPHYTAAEVASEVGCSYSYVTTIARTAGVKTSPARKDLKDVDESLFTADKTITELSEETGVSYSTLWTKARDKGLPYKAREFNTEATTLTADDLEVVEGMVFLGATQVAAITGKKYDKIKRHYRDNGIRVRNYTNEKVLASLATYGAEHTAYAFGVDEEVLHNINYVYDHKECPYTNEKVQLKECVRVRIKLMRTRAFRKSLPVIKRGDAL